MSDHIHHTSCSATTHGPRKLSEEERRRRRRRALFAYLVGDQRMQDYEIVDALQKMFGISIARSTVTRDLQWARQEGWIVTRMGEGCPGREELEAVKQTAHFYGGLQHSLQKRSEGTLKALHVFWSGSRHSGAKAAAEGSLPTINHTASAEHDSGVPESDEAWDERLVRFATRSAPTLSALLAKAERIGVTFGRTIGANIEALAEAKQGTRASRSTPGVVPTSGEPLGGARPEWASTDLAERLSQILGGAPVPSLRGISPVIQEEFRGRDHAIVLRFIRGLRSFREVFGDDRTRGLVGQLDTVLTSAGSFGERYHAFRNEYARIPGLSRERMGELALGDLGGVVISKDGRFTKVQQKAFAALRELWTGIRIEDFRRVSEAAKGNGHPGVILSAIGAHKADLTLALTCRERLVNHLVIDETLAGRLSELLHLSKAA